MGREYPMIAGQVYCWLGHQGSQGEIDQAFELLERAYAQRDGGLTESINDQFLNKLHNDPRWEPFLEKMRLLVYWQAKKERESAAGP